MLSRLNLLCVNGNVPYFFLVRKDIAKALFDFTSINSQLSAYCYYSVVKMILTLFGLGFLPTSKDSGREGKIVPLLTWLFQVR